MKNKKDLSEEFPYADPKIIFAFELLYKKSTTLENKFTKLLTKNPYGLISLPFPIFGTRLNQKERYWQNSNLRFVQEALIRFYMNSFQEDIINVAKKWKLDSSRYLIEEEHFAVPFMLPARQLFERELFLFQLINRIPSLKRQFPEADPDLLEQFSPFKWEKEIQNLMGKYGFEGFWKESIETLLLSGKWFMPRNPSIVTIELYDDNGNVDPKIFLEIFPSTPAKELEMRWEEIQWLKETIFRWKKKKRKLREDIFETLILDTSEKRWEFVETRFQNSKSLNQRKRAVKAILKKQQRILKEFREAQKRSVKILPRNIKLQIEKLKQPTKKLLIY